jgi:hypothetical protein
MSEWPTAELSAIRTRRLAAGHGDAFGVLDHAPLFDDGPDGRLPLDPVAAARLCAADVTRLSPGAALRPVLQQAALPTALSVVGLGEMNYHRFLAPLYAAAGVVRPRLVARCSLTLVPAWLERAAARWGRGVADIIAGTSAPALLEPCAETMAGLDAALEGLLDEAEQADPDLRVRLQAGHRRLRRERDRLHGSLARGRRRADELSPWGNLRAYLLPRGRPQDRTMSLFQAVWENGPGLVEALVAQATETGPAGSGLVRLS